MPSTRRAWIVAPGPLVDNTMWGLLSVVLLVGVARSSTPEQVGAAAAALTTYTVIVLALPVAVGDVMLLRHLAQDRDAVARAAGTVGGVSVVMAILIAVLGLVIGGSSGTTLVVLAFALPVLTLHELGRSVAYGRERIRVALSMDGMWLALATLAIFAVDGIDADTAFALWSAGCAVGLLVAVLMMRLRIARPHGWLREHRSQFTAFSTGASLQAIATQSGFLLSLWFLDLTEFATVRLAFLLFGPLTVMQNAIGRPLLTTAGAHGVHPGTLGRARIVLVGSSIAVGITIALVPRSLGVELLGASWDDVRSLTAWLVAAFAARGLAAVWIWQLMICGENARLIGARVGGAVVSATGIVLGAAIGGAEAATIGLALGNAVGAMLAGLYCRGVAPSSGS